MKQSESITKLAAALIAVQEHISPIVRDRENSHFKNSYATLDSIMESVRAPLAGAGLAIVQGGAGPITNVDGNICGVVVETLLLHVSGEFVSSVIALPLDKPSPQAVGSAVTYGRRYGVSAILSLTTEEDDDGNAASAPKHASRPAAKAAAATGHVGAAAKTMPMGKHKGERLGDVATPDLRSTVTWCSGDAEKKEKFKDLIAACEEVIHARTAA